MECRYVDAGAMVKQGDPILKLTNANLQLDVMYREALSYEQINNARNTRIAIEQNSIAVRGQVADVDYQLERARRAYRRDSVLAMKGMVSDLEYKQSSDDLRILAATAGDRPRKRRAGFLAEGPAIGTTERFRPDGFRRIST